jgi:hypothetical protein
MSVVFARRGRPPEEVVEAYPDFGVVEIPTIVLRDLGLDLRPEPVDGEPDHAVIVGRKTQGARRTLAKEARWVVRPPDAYPPLE